MTDLNLTSEEEAPLRCQLIDATHPGALLHDLQLVLDHIGEKGVKAGGKYNLLPIESILALDPQLARPMQLPLQRPQLRSHPYLQGLHLLLRASTLGRVQGKGDKARLVIDPAALESWNGLNPTERYFSLLEAWLLVAQPGMVGMQGEWTDCLLDRWSFLLSMLVDEKWKADTRPRLEHLFTRDYDEAYNVALADLFGLATVELPGGSVEDWARTRVKVTPFGEALLLLLAKWLKAGDEQAEPDEEDEASEDEEMGEDYEDEEDYEDTPEFGLLQPLLEPYFPAYQKALAVGGVSPAREGVFVFKVSLGKEVWRRIALAHDHTLHDLLRAILRSVRFDYDHLYSFTYRDALGRKVRADDPRCREGLSADTVRLGSLPLQPGQSMPLLYDYGDSWRFDVKLERIDAPGSVKKLPKVLESHGEAPKQYRDWE
jgi:hypothetical protein